MKTEKTTPVFRLSSFVYRLSSFAVFSLFLLAACGDFMEPVESTPEPTAYEFNYWLLNHTYLYEAELKKLPAVGDSIPLLYSALEDRYTRYYPPSKSEAAESHMNTSIVEGELGMEYMIVIEEGQISNYPIIISRVYADSPAGRANVPRFGRILEANGISLAGPESKFIYDSIVDYSAEIFLKVFFSDSIYHFDLIKEDVYTPTVFLDTISSVTFITITEFKSSTSDRENGTFGELKAYIDSTSNVSAPRVLDLRNNPGGLISQCLSAADLFVKEGVLSSRKFVTFAPDGKRDIRTSTNMAKSGDPGENGKFIMLANRASASCSEIFIAALKEQGNIPLAGETTFGKGIGQSQWKTIEGGFAVITNLEFFTPKGNSYHKKGINPDYPCSGSPTRNCALEVIGQLFGSENPAKANKGFQKLSTERQAVQNILLTSKDASPVTKSNLLTGGALDALINPVSYPYTP